MIRQDTGPARASPSKAGASRPQVPPPQRPLSSWLTVSPCYGAELFRHGISALV